MAPLRGNRVVEIGAVEIVNRTLTLRRFHSYLNCGRESDPESLAMHGLPRKFLANKPHFFQIAEDFGDFLYGAVLVAQPCEWTITFLDRELELANMPPTSTHIARVEDVVELAARRYHGRVTLNTLCARYGIRQPTSMNGTLLDSWMLGKAYLALTRNRSLLQMQEQ